MNAHVKEIGKTVLIALVTIVAYNYFAPKLMKKATPVVKA